MHHSKEKTYASFTKKDLSFIIHKTKRHNDETEFDETVRNGGDDETR
jgi:hypothetical protein